MYAYRHENGKGDMLILLSRKNQDRVGLIRVLLITSSGCSVGDWAKRQ